MNIFSYYDPEWPEDAKMWFSFAIMYTVTNTLIVLVCAVSIKIFNPSGFKEKMRENSKDILPYLVYGAAFGWIAFGLSFTGCPMPGMFTFMFSVVIGLIIEGIAGLMKEEREAKNKKKS